MLSIDFNDPQFIEDPYPTYKRLREAQGPYWLEHSQSNSLSHGMWLFTRYEDVAQILKASTSITKQIAKVRQPENLTLMEMTMLNQDPPQHTRLRNLVASAFSMEKIRELNDSIESIVDDLLINLAKQPEPDFVRDFSSPLPMRVIACFMGVPYEDHQIFGTWASLILRGYDSGVHNTDNFSSYKNAIAEMEDYFGRIIKQRYQKLGKDLISQLIRAQEDEGRLTAQELISMCMLLLVSGYETTTNFFSSGMLSLLRHPDQFNKLKNQPELLPSAIEEMLRFESPIQRATFRMTTQECEFGGKKLKAGEQLSVIIGAANRDPSQFENPDYFDITRNPNRHLAFGMGVHFCLGVVLARTEARISFSRILEKLPNLRLAKKEPVWNEKKLFRGLKSLPIDIF